MYIKRRPIQLMSVVFGQSINKHVRSNTEGQHAKWVNVQKLSGMISFTEAAGTSA